MRSSSSMTSNTIPLSSSSNNSYANSAENESLPGAGAAASNSNLPKLRNYDLHKGECSVLIFNYSIFEGGEHPREGSEYDEQRLKRFFDQYRVKNIETCKDYTLDETKKKMGEISEKSFEDVNCLINVIMSRGNKSGIIAAKDKCYNLYDEVVDRVLSNTSLSDKPKIFIIHAYIGEAVKETNIIPNIIDNVDVLLIYYTYKGLVSNKKAKKNLPFIQRLCDLIEKNDKEDLSQIMCRLRMQFAEQRLWPAPTEESTLTGPIYFGHLKKDPNENTNNSGA